MIINGPAIQRNFDIASGILFIVTDQADSVQYCMVMKKVPKSEIARNKKVLRRMFDQARTGSVARPAAMETMPAKLSIEQIIITFFGIVNCMGCYLLDALLLFFCP